MAKNELKQKQQAQNRDSGGGTPRFQQAIRNQVKMIISDLDSTIPLDHQVRLIWSFVQEQDLSSLYDSINAVEGGAGRSPIDPRILMTLWLYATIDGIGSARELARQCRENVVYQWICGDVSVNYHTISDFRKDHRAALDRILTIQVATLIHEGLVDLIEVSTDGVRVRASAGSGSFHRRRTLESCLEEAKAQVTILAQEMESGPGQISRRVQAARQRAVRERTQRLQDALKRMSELEARAKEPEPEKIRASSTDPDATKMKMANGGFSPAYNLEVATDTHSQIIVAVDVNCRGQDWGQLPPMMDQIKSRYQRYPKRSLADGGFRNVGHLDRLAQPPYNIEVYCPPYRKKNARQDTYQPLPTDSPWTAERRIRMGSESGQQIYRRRAAVSELNNARFRNHGLQQLLVRGKKKIMAVLLWYAIALNILEIQRLHKIA